MTPIRISFPVAALLTLVTCFFACSPPPEDKQAGATGAGIDTVPSSTTNSCLINGELPVLWIEATEFLKLRGKPAFRFFIDDNKDLTLSAWNSPYDDQAPVFTLKTSILSTVQASSGNYLGNLVIDAKKLAAIEKEIRDNGWTKVRFRPFIDTSAVGKNQVIYYIEFTNDPMPPRPLDPKDPLYLLRDTSNVVPPGGYELNPSPPRNE